MRRPTRRRGRWPTLRWAICSRSPNPSGRWRLFDEAAQLAGEVQNFWWCGIALMEAAATRAVHGDPATAARMFIKVLDHWDRVGDWAEQWVTLRYITRLLVRLGADDDALFLQCAVVKAGKPPPLSAAKLRGPRRPRGRRPIPGLLRVGSRRRHRGHSGAFEPAAARQTRGVTPAV